MGKIYRRKTDRQSWSKDNMKRALTEVKNRQLSVNAASKAYNIPEATLRRYAKKYPDENFPENAGRFKPTFSDEQLNQLKKYVLDIDQRAFGLTKDQFRKIAFDFAVHCGVADRFNTAKKMVGKDFTEAFMKKCNLALRKPEATSAARLMAFNKVNVEAFFKLYKELHKKYAYSATQIYNIDETGFSSVPTKDPKVLTPKGNRRVLKISSAERGVNVTAVCGMNAIGNFIPPFLIFPRAKMQPALKHGAPEGTMTVAHPSGWMTTENFVKYLEHFMQYARPNEQNRILILMDNHSSHVSLEAIKLCRENHITMLGFPPHTSHRMQPLDVSIYGPLKTAYSRACEDFLTSNPGRLITLYDISSLFGKAYLKAANVANALSGFRATGIYPIDSQVFDTLDFEASLTTDRDKPISTEVPTTSALENRVLEPDIPEITSQSDEESDQMSNGISAIPIPATPGPSTSGIITCTPPHGSDILLNKGLPKLPVAEVKSKRPRKKLPSLVISSTPVVKVLEEKEAEKIEKERKRKIREQKKSEKQRKSKGSNLQQKNKKAALNKTKGKTIKRKLKFNDSSDSSVDVDYADIHNDLDSEDERDCIICSERGKDEIWYCCCRCKEWAHAECTAMDNKEAKLKQWTCDWCM